MFGLRKWSTPVMRPMGPFVVSGFVVIYLVGKLQTAMIDSDMYRNDPRNPAHLAGKKEAH